MRPLPALLAASLSFAVPIMAADLPPASASPWGKAPVAETRYAPRKVIYDVVSGDPAACPIPAGGSAAFFGSRHAGHWAGTDPMRPVHLVPPRDGGSRSRLR